MVSFGNLVRERDNDFARFHLNTLGKFLRQRFTLAGIFFQHIGRLLVKVRAQRLVEVRDQRLYHRLHLLRCYLRILDLHLLKVDSALFFVEHRQCFQRQSDIRFLAAKEGVPRCSQVSVAPE